MAPDSPAFDQLQAACIDAWRQQGMDLVGEESDSLVPVRSAITAIEALAARRQAHVCWEDAVDELLEVLRATMLPPHLGFSRP